MSLRVNTNPSALNTHRQLTNSTASQTKSLERLSSGLKINRGADGPSQLQISEQFRAQAAGLRQAIDNTEMGVSLIQTAEAALDEVSRSLINARQIAVHAANEATNDPFMLQADQQEVDNILSTINRIASNTQYGKNFLLDGSKAGNGVAIGDGLEFIEGGSVAKTSGPSGYRVKVTQLAQRAEVSGSVALDQSIIDKGEQITITEGGRTLNFKTVAGTSVEQTLNELDKAMSDAGLNLELLRPDPLTADNDAPLAIRLRHKDYGSEQSFTVASSTAGVLSVGAGIPQTVANGADIQGEINGEAATGKGQLLTGGPGANSVEGITMRYTGDQLGTVGTLTFAQNSLNFQIGGNANQVTSVSMKSMRASTLATGVSNSSGFRSLGDLSLLDASKAQDSIRMIDRAIEEVASARGELGAFQKNSLESNLNFLRIAHENVMGSESVIRDADMAAEMATFTRNQIMQETGMAMLAQANQRPMSVLSLLS
jgi:flagellin